MKKPLLSVIIPVYNTAKSVERIVNRVLSQELQDIELILVDDGSTDNSPEVLRKIAKKDMRVKVISQKNSGPSGARNTGLSRARGEFILLLDSDDDISPKMIPAMMKKQQSTNADLVTCAIKEVYPNGRVYVPDIEPRIIDATKEDVILFALNSMGKETSVIYNPSNRIMRTSIIKNNNLKYLRDLRFGEDLTFNLEFLKHVKKIAVMRQPFYVYYQSSPTSVFSESVIDYSYRQKNTDLLWKFTNLSRNPAAHDFAIWVQTRWFLSFCKFICISSLSQREKYARVAYACQHEKFKGIASSNTLTFGRYAVIKITLLLVKAPLIFYLFISILSRIIQK